MPGKLEREQVPRTNDLSVDGRPVGGLALAILDMIGLWCEIILVRIVLVLSPHAVPRHHLRPMK